MVHAHGQLRAVDDAAWMLALLERLTATHEAARESPWSVHDAPREWVEKIVRVLVGIEIALHRMQGKWKMSQNRTQEDQRMVAADTGMAIYPAR